MILVDSSVWIDYFNGRETWQTDKLDNLLGREALLIGDIILTEVLQGFRDEGDYKNAKEALMAFPCFNIGGVEIAIKSASNFRLLRKRGLTVRKTIDILIATFCIHNGYSLLHNDADFAPMVDHLGLQVLTFERNRI